MESIADDFSSSFSSYSECWTKDCCDIFLKCNANLMFFYHYTNDLERFFKKIAKKLKIPLIIS